MRRFLGAQGSNGFLQDEKLRLTAPLVEAKSKGEKKESGTGEAKWKWRTHTKGPHREGSKAWDHLAGKTGPLFRLLVPVNGDANQNHRDDPQNNVFTLVFFLFFSHRGSTAYLKIRFKCCFDFLRMTTA
jgi:hypothetical protein